MLTKLMPARTRSPQERTDGFPFLHGRHYVLLAWKVDCPLSGMPGRASKNRDEALHDPRCENLERQLFSAAAPKRTARKPRTTDIPAKIDRPVGNDHCGHRKLQAKSGRDGRFCRIPVPLAHRAADPISGNVRYTWIMDGRCFWRSAQLASLPSRCHLCSRLV